MTEPIGPKYVRLTENNEWEAETWHKYLPVEGNQGALHQLGVFLGQLDGDDAEWFFLNAKELPESVVDVLCEYGNDGNCTYMDQHEKLRGRLNVDKLSEVTQLNKGQITNYLFDGAPGDPWPEKPINQ